MNPSSSDSRAGFLTRPLAMCSSNAAAAVLAYAPSGSSAGEWFLPSRVEMKAMCNYCRNPAAPAAPSASCGTTQDGTTPRLTRIGFVRYGPFSYSSLDPSFSSQLFDRKPRSFS